MGYMEKRRGRSRESHTETNCSLGERFTKGATPQTTLKLLKKEPPVSKGKVRCPLLKISEGGGMPSTRRQQGCSALLGELRDEKY